MDEIDNVKGNISSIINVLKNWPAFRDSKEEIWFRGQAKYSHELIPSLFRHKQDDNSNLYYDESGMYGEFVRRYPDHSSNHKNIFEWLTLMQHYDLPTRLLDWSTNLLTALFFCCNDDKYKNEDGAVFAFIQDYPTLPDFGILSEFMEILVTSKNAIQFYDDLYDAAEKKFGGEVIINGVGLKERKIELKKPSPLYMSDFESFNISVDGIVSSFPEGLSSIIPYKPPHLNPRIRQQHGCFTFHGGKNFETVDVIKIHKMEDNNDLIKIMVKSTDKEKLLKELALSGISEATLYPEMEYQTKQIKEIYKILDSASFKG